MSAMAIAMIAEGIIKGVSAFAQSKEASSAAKAQAVQVQQNVENIKNLVETNRIDLQEALRRIDTIIENTKGELKKVIDQQTKIASNNLQTQYKEALRTNLDNVRTSLVQRGLGGSGALVASEQKTAEALQKNANQAESNLRQNAMLQLQKTIAGLNMQGANLKENKRDRFSNFKNNALQNIWQLENVKQGLESQAKANPWLAALSGSASSIGNIVGTFAGRAGTNQQTVNNNITGKNKLGG